MKVFISWSGHAERRVAESLSETLSVVTAGRVEPFVSSQSIPKGARGIQAIGTNLSASDYGIVILSAANQHAPWITYEAGALAKSVEAPVATLLLDLIPSDVTGPLESFQATVFTSPDDVRRLFVEIAQLADTAMPERSVSILFEAAWSSLRDSWTPPTSDDAAHEPRRDEADMLSELVNRMRRMELRLADPDRSPRKLTKEWVKDPEGKVERLKFTATPSVGIVATLISLLSAYANGDASARDELLELGVDPDRKAASVNDAIMQITNDMKKPSD